MRMAARVVPAAFPSWVEWELEQGGKWAELLSLLHPPLPLRVSSVTEGRKALVVTVVVGEGEHRQSCDHCSTMQPE